MSAFVCYCLLDLTGLCPHKFHIKPKLETKFWQINPKVLQK
jgi:hypothetical protein